MKLVFHAITNTNQWTSIGIQKMRDFNYSMKNLAHRNRDGSFATQANRTRMLNLFAEQLHKLGYNNLKDAHQLKGRHIHKLVNHWKETNVSIGTIKNRMAVLRWMAEKVNNRGLIATSNDHYGIEKRCYVTNEDKSVVFHYDKIDRIAHPLVQASAMLQREFGLRREEALKIIPTWADRGGKLSLKASWAKGGRAREIPIKTDEQRQVLDHAKRIAGKASLIPADKKYVQHIATFERHMAKVGLSRTHGARHLYAQTRYKDITGWLCPASGGKTSKELSIEEKEKDRSARLIISAELGHNRESITAIYLGR